MASVAEIKLCLTCKKPISGVPIFLDSSDTDNILNRQKLKIVVPEWNLVKNKEYVICTSCSCKLSTSYKFRMMCLSSASIIREDPVDDIKIEPEEIDNTSTNNSNLKKVNLSVALEEPLVAVTGDVQKSIVAIKSKFPVEVHKQASNKNIEKRTSPIPIQPKPVTAFLKPLCAVDKSATGDVPKQNVLVAVKAKYAVEVDKQASNKNIQKSSSTIAILPKTMAALYKSSPNSNMQKMIQVVATKAVPKAINNKQNLLGNMRKVSATKTSVAVKPKSVTGIALPINMDVPIESMEIDDGNHELGSKGNTVTGTAIIAKSVDSQEDIILDPLDITAAIPKIEYCDTPELEDHRTVRKLIMKSLYKAVIDTNESGVSPSKRQFTCNSDEPEINLSETIMQNWNKNISLLVRNDMLNSSTSSVEKEKLEADGSPELNQRLEISETPPEVKKPPEVNPAVEVNKPAEVNAPVEVNEPTEVKAEEIEIKSESDDVEFVSEIFLEPSTSRRTVKSKPLKAHEQDQQQRSLDVDLSMKGKTTFLCKCNHCGLLLTSKETLVKHIRQHFKNNPVQCDQCKTQFGDISSYNAHTCIYDKGKKAVVSEFEPECPKPKECKCNLYFGNIRTLNIHLETTCENSMFCMTCNMGFADPISMDCHLRNVHNLFLCNLCRKMFRDKKYLMTHLHMMHEKKTTNKKIKYRCPFKSCKKSFKFYETYELHLTYKHQEYYSNIYWEDCKTSYMTYMCNLCKNHDKPACLNLLDQSAFIVQLQRNHAL